MNTKIQDIYESVRNNYSALHLAIYTSLLTKVQKNISVPLSNESIIKNSSFCLHPFYVINHPHIDLEDGYQIRLDYIAYACEVEGKQKKFQIIQETALVAYTGRIIQLFFELLNTSKRQPKTKDKNFEQYCINKLKNQYIDFIEILSFLRHTFVHNTSYDFSMENTDDFLSGWIKKQGGKTLQLKALVSKNQNYIIDITLKTTKLDIEKETEFGKIQTLFDIINISQIYMLLEICMNFADEYFKQNSLINILNPTPSE